MAFVFEEKESEDFSGLEWTESHQLADRYQSCTFLQCNFQGVDLDKICFSDCTFTNCNLSLCTLKEATFNECIFKECKLVALDWTATASLRSPTFEGCMMDANNFAEMKLAYSNFSDSRLRDVQFNGANLKEAMFNGCDLEGTQFFRCDLRKADFRQARAYRLSLLDNQASKAKFSFPEAVALLQEFDIVVE